MKPGIIALAMAAILPAAAAEIGVSGTRFLLDGKPFPYTGISFFNAIDNPAFNKSPEDRAAWLGKFRKYGINVLRVWAQWDNKRGFIDVCPECSLYFPDGRLRQNHVDRLKQIAAEADRNGMAIELALFCQESFGGPKDRTYPFDHMVQICRVWEAGAYITYHHDMFQTGAGSAAVPPSGVPDPEFSPYHRAVLEFIALRERYAPRQ